MSRNLKIFLVTFLLSLPFWWSVNAFQNRLENFLYARLSIQNSYLLSADVNSLVLKPRLSSHLNRHLLSDLKVPTKSFFSVLVSQNGQEKILAAKNVNTKLPIASLTKLMTAFTALDIYQPSLEIQSTRKAVLTEGVAGNISPGEIFQLSDLIKIMLIESSNDAAESLVSPIGDKAFVQLMNFESKKLKLKRTHFVNPTGLDPQNSQKNGNVSTAQDLKDFVKYLIFHQPKILDISRHKTLNVISKSDILHRLSNTDILLNEFPNVFGSKTGYTKKAKGCLILVLKTHQKNTFLVNIILGSDNRFEAMRELIG